MSDIPIGDPNNDDQIPNVNINVVDVNALINLIIIIATVIAVGQNLLNAIPMVEMRGWTPEETAINLAATNWDRYSQVLLNSPIQTKALTSATVYTIGDFIAQKAEGLSLGEIDRPRIVRSMMAGLIAHGPLSHFWYHLCDDVFDNMLHLTQWWSVFPKVIVDQTTWGPLWNNTYILLLGIMKLDSWEKIWDEMKRTTIPLIVSGMKLWPLAHCVTYGLVPVENRLLWVDIVEIVWVFILATAVSGGGHGHGAPVVDEEDTTATE